MLTRLILSQSILRRLLLVIFASFIFGSAFASATVEASNGLNLKPPPGDLSVMFLGNLFGVVDGVLAGTGSQIAGTIFGVFNAAVLSLGGLLVGYTVMVSTMNTAADGKFLGDRFSSIWVPTRTVAGTVLLLPKVSGYCIMQIFIMWVVIQGIGAADKIWSQALSYLNRGGAIVKPNVDPITNMQKNNDSTVFNAAYGMFASQVCMEAVEKGIIRYRNDWLTRNNCDQITQNTPGSPSSYFCQNEVPSFIESVDFLEQVSPVQMPSLNAENMQPYDVLTGICGSVEFNTFSLSANDAAAMGINVVELETINKSRNVALNQMYTFLGITAKTVVENDPNLTTNAGNYQWGLPLTVDLAQCEAMTNPYTKSQVYSSNACLMWELENGALTTVLLRGTEIQDAVATYNGMMSASLFIQSQTTDTSNYRLQREFITNANQSGWILAGAYYFRLAILTSQVLKKSSSTGNDDATSGLNVCATGSGATCSHWSTSHFSNGFTTSTAPVCNGNPNDYGVSNNYLFCNDTAHANQGISNITDQTISLIKSEGTVGTIPRVVSNTMIQPTYSSANTNYHYPNSVYGYLVNSTALVMPGQPGNQQPEFIMSVDFNASTNVPQLGSSHIKGGMWNIPGQIISLIYNSVLKEFFNMLLSLVIPMVNMMFFAFIQPPLTLLASVFLGALEVLKNTDINPILGLTNMGVNLIEGSANAFILMIGVAVGAAMIGTAALGLLMMLMPIISLWLGIMFSVGSLASFYLPFIPFMYFLFATIAWFITVIEAMVAGPLIALGIMHPEGDQAFGKGEGAVMLLMGLFLRPSMMIMGYIFGIILSYVGIWFVNAGFVMVVPDITNLKMVDINTGSTAGYSGAANAIDNGMQSIGQAMTGNDSVYGMWSTIFLLFFTLLVYITTLVSVASKSFELIAILPDKIMRWISGGQEEQTATRVSGTMKQEMQQQHNKATQASSEAVAKIGGSMMAAGLNAMAALSEMADKASQKADESAAQNGDEEAQKRLDERQEKEAKGEDTSSDKRNMLRAAAKSAQDMEGGVEGEMQKKTKKTIQKAAEAISKMANGGSSASGKKGNKDKKPNDPPTDMTDGPKRPPPPPVSPTLSGGDNGPYSQTTMEAGDINNPTSQTDMDGGNNEGA